eukprot:13292465-Alexandrium_andersonii.AAC.1
MLAAGTPLEQLELLKTRLSEYVFIPIAGRLQEAEHSLITLAEVHRTVSGAYVSTRLCFPEILSTIMPHPERMR